MKPTHKLILIAIFFAILQQISCASLYADKELCKLYEPETDQSVIQALTTTPISISQDTCVQRFMLDLNDPMWMNQFYIYIEVQFDPFPDPSPEFSMFLLEADDEQPIIYYSDKGIHEDATTDDYDAYRNRKTFHRISLSTGHFLTRDTRKRYFAVYKLFEDLSLYPDSSHVVSYTIRARAPGSMEFECINNCNGQGKCDTRLQQCVCHAGFFDSDCSVKALRLNSGVPQSQPVPAHKSAYYYTSYQSQDDVFKFSFSLNRPEWDMAVQFNYPNDFLINSRRAFQFTNHLSELQTSQEYSSKAIPALGGYFGGDILVFVSNPTNNSMYSTVQVDIHGKEKSKLLLIIAVVAGVVLFLMVIGAFIIKKCRARAARSARDLELEEVQGEPRQRANPQEQQSVFLTKAEIEKYFPLNPLDMEKQKRFFFRIFYCSTSERIKIDTP